MTYLAAFETAHPAPTPSPSSPPPGLSAYLVDHGVLQPDDLDEAHELMRIVNVSLAEIAVEEGVLSARQAETIAREQRCIDAHWSELALALGMGQRTAQRIDELCTEQDVSNLRLGDALVELGIVSATTLERYADQLAAEQPRAPALAVDSLGTRTALELLPRLCTRALGSWGQLGSARTWDGAAAGIHATASFEGPHGMAIGLSLDRASARMLAGNFEHQRLRWSDAVAPVLVADFVGMIAQMVRAKLDPAGLDHGELQLTPDQLPTHGTAFDIALETGAGVLVVDTGE